MNWLKQIFCKLKNWEWQWGLQNEKIKVCKDCNHKDYGFHNNRFYYKF